MKQCRGCGRELTKRSQKVYCSVDCQHSSTRAGRTAEWLKSGVASVGSKAAHYVRRHLLDEQDGCCAICGIVEEWNGQPLVLIPDHIDADASNNRRENLRMICPNCDSQLPTYKSRNRGKGRHFRRECHASGQSY